MSTELDGLVDLSALGAWMDRSGLAPGPIEDVQRLTGGTQNVLLRFTRAGTSYVLRRPPRHLRAVSNETLLREARMLGALTGQGVPAPALIAACEDESVLGAAFFLMEPVEGFNAANGMPELHTSDATVRHRMGLSAIEGIAAVAALDHEAIGLADFGKPEGFLERQVPRWLGELTSYADLDGYQPTDFPDVTPIAEWLEARVPSTYQPGIVHGDFHAANLFFEHESGELAAILDWEMATIGDPLLDLGWFVATWPSEKSPALSAAAGALAAAGGLATRTELIGHYEKHSSRDVAEIDWYAVLACFKLGIVLEGSYARACAGKMDKDVGGFLHAMGLALIEQADLFMTEGVG
ncbi:MAG TPA: phosphotransferase family protein [Nocardioidaceae bacterium]|nr:phosphotransferase family protein [Nocardioidaceae bacterium]